MGEGRTGGASDIVVKAESSGEDPRATGGLVSDLPHHRVDKTKQHTQSAAVAMAGDGNVEECSPSVRPSPTALTASPSASHAYRRCAESSCTSPSALPCRGWRPRAAITTLRGGHNNKCAAWCTSPQPKSSGSTHSFTVKSSGSTHSITFKSSGSTDPFNFKSSGSTRTFRPSCLSALVPSGPRAFFRPLRLQALAPWALMPPGPRAFRPSCLLQVLISSLSWSSLPHMLFNCLLYLLVL